MGLESQKVTLTCGKQSDWTIIISEQCSPSEHNAALELQRFIKQISDVQLPILFDIEPYSRKELIIGLNRHLLTGTEIDENSIAELGDEGYFIEVSSDVIAIAGGALRGTMYGVYSFLEDYLGCRWFTSNPEATIISISQNDYYNPCECEHCAAIDTYENSHAGTLIYFVNCIAESLQTDYPHIIIDTLAYQYSRKPPKHVKPHKNVAIRLSTIECCFAHPLGDEGGGYDIGRRGMIAAIYSSDGRGEKSALEQRLLSLLGASSMPNAIGAFYGLASQKQFISSFAKIVVDVSSSGDAAATSILEQAGIDMAIQIEALFKSIGEQSDICISGSIWKHNPIMLGSFSDYVSERYPHSKIIESIYEPVMGGIIKQWLMANTGTAFEAVSQNFSPFEYHHGKEARYTNLTLKLL